MPVWGGGELWQVMVGQGGRRHRAAAGSKGKVMGWARWRLGPGWAWWQLVRWEDRSRLLLVVQLLKEGELPASE